MASPARVGPFYIVNQMKRTLALVFATLFCVSMKGYGQIDLPYNPDGDSNGLIGTSDLQSILAVYGTDFMPGATLVDSVELYDYLTQLQGELGPSSTTTTTSCFPMWIQSPA